MAGWTHEKRVQVETAFYAFLKQCFVNSKDKGKICLGDYLYFGQILFITAIFDALEKDIHDIYVLKSRQLGISTIARAFATFWLGVHDGIKGAIVFDTAPHKEEARIELVAMINDLPDTLGFPKIPGRGTGNREFLQLDNDSRVQFLSAGAKQSKTSGTLGRSSGLSMALMSELCSYDNQEGLKSFEQSLSEEHPNRLYIRESTGRSYNQWYYDWKKARADTPHCVCVFLGWWSKESQKIERDHPDFQLYGTIPPNKEELTRIKAVKELYDYDITPEQLAWIRRKTAPNLTVDNSEQDEGESTDAIMLAEQAWTEDEAFQLSGSVFFPSESLNAMASLYASNKFQGYQYFCGAEFTDMRVSPTTHPASIELRVWEPPENDGSYIVAVDPAYGENPENDRSAVQVLRCYADGMDQVAEYASPLVTTRQLAWIVWSLCGWYGQDKSEVRYVLELNGPGMPVFDELKAVKSLIQNDRSYLYNQIFEQGLQNTFRNVKTYIWSRPDAMGRGNAYHFKTNVGIKVRIMERLRDFTSNGKLRIRSIGCIEEMRAVSRDGDKIEAPGGMKDDRVVSLAMGVHYWDIGPRRNLVAFNRTRESVEAAKRLSVTDQVRLFHQNQLQSFLGRKQGQRMAEYRAQRYQNWRHGR